MNKTVLLLVVSLTIGLAGGLALGYRVGQQSAARIRFTALATDSINDTLLAATLLDSLSTDTAENTSSKLRSQLVQQLKILNMHLPGADAATREHFARAYSTLRKYEQRSAAIYSLKPSAPDGTAAAVAAIMSGSVSDELDRLGQTLGTQAVPD